MCEYHWETRDKFLDDKTLKLNGYQADFDIMHNGMFFFTHHVDGCYSTMVILSSDFFDLYTGIRYSERKTGSAACRGYCLNRDSLERCEAECEYAFVREIIQIIRERQSA